MAFINISGPEIILIIAVVFTIVTIGHYGRKTALGYTGSVLLSLVTSPLIGFAVVYYLRSKSAM